MSKGDTFENDLLKLIFHGTAIADLAENDATSPLTSLYLALHTGDPGEAGAQNTNECSYTGYARVAVTRDSGGWTITNNIVNPAAIIDFPVCTGGSETASYASIGTASSGAGKILFKGTVTPNIVIAPAVVPRLLTTSTITED